MKSICALITLLAGCSYSGNWNVVGQCSDGIAVNESYVATWTIKGNIVETNGACSPFTAAPQVDGSLYLLPKQCAAVTEDDGTTYRPFWLGGVARFRGAELVVSGSFHDLRQPSATCDTRARAVLE